MSLVVDRAVQVLPVTGRIGAEITGIRLSGDLDSGAVATIRQALLDHKVVFFRGQDHLDDRSQDAFASLLGPTTGHPTVPHQGETNVGGIVSATGVRANNWHTDVTFVANYPAFSILRGVEFPEFGGDTLWANTVTAYQDLPAELQQLADRLWAVHNNAFDYAAKQPSQWQESAVAFQRDIFSATEYETEHPVVRVHPETGQKSLLLGGFVKRIVGFTTSDSAALIEIFNRHITRPENLVRWRWTAGDVAIWDNRATQHYAPDDYSIDVPREVRRVTVAGDIPVSVDGERSRVRKGGDTSWYAGVAL
jgi:alpha-ketoglutarate-dependent taurine dioxygenase